MVCSGDRLPYTYRTSIYVWKENSDGGMGMGELGSCQSPPPVWSGTSLCVPL
jgi:hypothetical protein